MAQFTALAESEIARLADAFQLGDVRACAPIAAGTINSNFRVTTDRGDYFVRINEGKSEADVAWEARVVRALADGGVVTPAPVLAGDGKPYAPLGRKWVSVFPWRDGKHLAPDEVTAEHADKFGAALAELHRVGLAVPAAWRRGSIYEHEHLVARYDRFADTLDPALGRAIAVLADELVFADAAQRTRRRATQGIIHGDLFRDNVLWEAGEVVAILDFEQASGGSLAYDLGVCINDWCWADGPRIDLAVALVAGYQRVRPLTQADRDALPIEVRVAATRFTITRITDVYLARLANPEKDFRAFLARVDAWRGPALGQLTASL